MSIEDRKSSKLGHVVALLALPMLVLSASVSASHTREELATSHQPAALYGLVVPYSDEDALR